VDYLDTLIGNILVAIVNPLILLLLGIATAFFIWGLVEFIRDFDSEEAKTKGKKHMIWGIVGLFIMVSAFGIMCTIAGTLNLPNSVLNRIPFC